MSTVWRKAMIALGLGDDDDYDEYGDEPVQRPLAPSAPTQQAAPAAVQPRSVQPVANRTASVSALPGVPGTEAGQVRFPANAGPPDQPPVRTVSASGGEAAPAKSGVRTIARPSAKPHVIAPRSFRGDAPEVGDRFKAKQPVIVNLQGVERDLSRRLVDFASGLCYGLGGQMEKVATDVFLLTPADVEVSAEERERLSERGLYDA
jgi:cell division inhibitor SepF